MMKYVFIFCILFSATFAGCSSVASDVLTSCQIESESIVTNNDSMLTLSNTNVDAAINFCRRERASIQDFFQPKDVAVFSHDLLCPESIPSHIRFYPFGKIVGEDEKGISCFVIFIQEGYQVKQSPDLLRVTPTDISFSSIPVFMEITQVANITLEEMENEILASINFSRYPLSRHIPPLENFPFVVIEFIDGGRQTNKIVTTYLKSNSRGGVFVITTQYPVGGRVAYRQDLRNALKTLETIKIPFNHDLFESKFAILFIEGLPTLIRHYPFTETNDTQAEGRVSFVIYIEDIYLVEQTYNLLRIIPRDNEQVGVPDIFMEIKQLANVTVAELVQSFSDKNFAHSGCGQSPRGHEYVSLFYLEGVEWDSAITSVHIEDNGLGGVFVVTAQYPQAAMSGHGVRFRNSLATIRIKESE